MKAALLWSMLEEARLHIEDHFNLDEREATRPLREAVSSITGWFFSY